MTTRQFTHQELEHLTRYWCRTLGIHSKDLEAHPQIDDVIILIKFIDEFGKELKPNQRVKTYLIWDYCYKQRHSLTKKYLNTLNRIGNQILFIRNEKLKHKQKQRQKIKALRQTLPA